MSRGRAYSGLQSYRLGGFADGYSSFSGSRTNLKDTQFPAGQDAVLDDLGSVSKAPGATLYWSIGPDPVRNLEYWNGNLYGQSGTTVYRRTGSASGTALTGATFDATKRVWFCKALGRLYVTQEGNPNLYYTENGISLNLVANGRGGVSPVFFFQRLYVIDDATGRIWYSNPHGVTVDPPAISIADFGTFHTSLVATPKRNAGFIEFDPGDPTGVRKNVTPVRLFIDKDVIYAFTSDAGYWSISPSTTLNADGSINHTVRQENAYFGTASPLSVGKVGNDTWFDDQENLVTVGEVATYVNVRATVKSGAIRGDMDGRAPALVPDSVLGFKDSRVYFAYAVGSSGNDRMAVFDTILSAWSAPSSAHKAACFLTFQDGPVERIVYGSSVTGKVYEMAQGLDVDGSPIDSWFETRATDCGTPVPKLHARAKVYYSLILGQLNYDVYLDGFLAFSGKVQFGGGTQTFGMGSRPLGSRAMGSAPAQNSASTASRDNDFDIDLDFTSAKRVYIRFSNASTGETYKIDDVEFFFKETSIYNTDAYAPSAAGYETATYS